MVGVSSSGFYAWLKRQLSKRKRQDEKLKVQIKEIHHRSRGTYGAPRVLAELKFLGVRVSKKRVQRLMKELGLQGASRRRW
ncbi:MAG: transposase [Bdellovibrionales bacterium]|nr:transposase [Bdellovibrionales bacterium]